MWPICDHLRSPPTIFLRFFLISSNLFATNADYIRRQIIYGLLQVRVSGDGPSCRHYPCPPYPSCWQRKLTDYDSYAYVGGCSQHSPRHCVLPAFRWPPERRHVRDDEWGGCICPLVGTNTVPEAGRWRWWSGSPPTADGVAVRDVKDPAD